MIEALSHATRNHVIPELVRAVLTPSPLTLKLLTQGFEAEWHAFTQAAEQGAPPHELARLWRIVRVCAAIAGVRPPVYLHKGFVFTSAEVRREGKCWHE